MSRIVVYQKQYSLGNLKHSRFSNCKVQYRATIQVSKTTLLDTLARVNFYRQKYQALLSANKKETDSLHSKYDNRGYDKLRGVVYRYCRWIFLTSGSAGGAISQLSQWKSRYGDVTFGIPQTCKAETLFVRRTVSLSLFLVPVDHVFSQKGERSYHMLSISALSL